MPAEVSTAEESIIIRGTRAPKQDLAECIEFLQKIHEDLGERKMTREGIAKSLGHAGLSGTATVKVGSLTHYGLLDRAGDSYVMSDLAKKILQPRDASERQVAIQQAAKTPNLFGKLVNELDGKPIPNMLVNILQRDYGVAADNAAPAVAVFRRTLEFAGLLDNGLVVSDPTPATAQPPIATPAAGSEPAATKGVEVKNLPSPPSDTYSIPLSKSRVAILSLPRPVAETDLQRIKKWVDLMADVLTEQEETVSAD